MFCIQIVCIQIMADTSLNESKIGILVWKTSLLWQSKLRKVLHPYNISLNEYLILESIRHLSKEKTNIYQNQISELIGIDISVTSVCLKSLNEKKYISRNIYGDNRKKIIEILKKGDDLFKIIQPLIQKEEDLLFNKLNNETFNFKNSLKLLLGKKIRIRAIKQNL